MVCRSVSEPCKTAEPIKIAFGLRNRMLDRGSRFPMARGNFEGKGRPIAKYSDALPKTAEPIEMPFGLRIRVGPETIY